MSFRNRLRLFFATIVVAPMLVIAAVLYVLIFSAESGKADAAFSAKSDVAVSLYNDARERALVAGRAIARDVPFATAIRRNDPEQLQTRASDLLGRRGVQRIVVARGTNARVRYERPPTFAWPPSRRVGTATFSAPGSVLASASPPSRITTTSRPVVRLTDLA